MKMVVEAFSMYSFLTGVVAQQNRTPNSTEIYICTKMNLIIPSGSICECQKEQGRDAY